MSARHRVHTDGSEAVQQDGCPDRWMLVSGPDYEGPVHIEVHGEGWSEAALEVLPEPTGTDDAGPYWDYLDGGRVYAGDADNALYANEDEQERRELLEREALGLLAAARWVEQTPVPLATGSDREI